MYVILYRHSRWDDYVDDDHGHRIRPGPVVMLNNIVPAARKEDVSNLFLCLLYVVGANVSI